MAISRSVGSSLLCVLLLASTALAGAPSTAVIDNCDRTENPLSDGGKWTNQVLTGDVDLQATATNFCRASVNTSDASAYRNDQNYGPNAEAGFTLSGTLAASSVGVYRVYLRLQGAGLGAGTPNGYYVDIPRIRDHAPTNDEWRIFRLDAGVPAPIGSSFFLPNVALGDSVAANIIASGSDCVIEAWHKPSAGSWTSVGSRTESPCTYTAAGKIGMGLNSDNTAEVDDFFGGTLATTATTTTPQRTLTGVGQ